ncbi:MAG: hypothetical protein ACR2FH_11505 [Caulobacteraceae bacterium]
MKAALFRWPSPSEDGALKVVIHLHRRDFVRINRARRRGLIGRDAFYRLVMGLGMQALEALVAEEADT